MPRIDHGVVRQCGEQTSYRLGDLASASCREICAAVGACKQGIPGEDHIAHLVADAAGGMTGGLQDGEGQLVQLDGIALMEQAVVCSGVSNTFHVNPAMESSSPSFTVTSGVIVYGSLK